MTEAIRQLDRRFKALRPLTQFPCPPKGWVRAIRDALGMTTRQLGNRLGVSQPRVTEIEKAELCGSITLASLERAAEALDCRVVYALVPNRPLAEIVAEKAAAIAEKKLAEVRQTMALEAQSVSDAKAEKEMRRKLIEDLLQHPARLWDDA